MLSIATGYDTKYLTDAVAAGREGYYSGAVAAGEPPGVWFGAGAEALGLSGEVDAEQMEAIYSHLVDPRDERIGDRERWAEAATLGKPHKNYRTPAQIYETALQKEPGAGPERRAELRAEAERSARQPVSFLDITFNAPKSISVAAVAFERAANEAAARGDLVEAAAWEAHHRAMEEAVLAGARAGIAFLQDKAGYARVGHHGGKAGRWIDAHEWVSGLFLQHDSRDGDPHLHAHGPTLNRALCSDGEWRALDTRAIFAWKPAAGAVADRVAEAYAAKAVGLLFAIRPDGKAREIVGIDQAMRDLFSSRRFATTAKAAELIAAYAAHKGRNPSALESWRLNQQATLTTRKPKTHRGETRGAQFDRWGTQWHGEMTATLAEVAHDLLARHQEAGPAETWSQDDVIERALTVLAERHARWTYPHAFAAVGAALPGHLGLDPDDVVPLIAGLTDRLITERAERLTPAEDTSDLPPEYQLADGSSAFARPGADLFATPEQLAGVHALRNAAIERGAATLTPPQVADAIASYAAAGVELGVDQQAAVRGVLTSGARVEVLAAAAGTGKTVVTGALAHAWQAGGRRGFGLAPSEVATEVLAEEGVTARNVTKWLTTQENLATTEPGGSPAGVEPWRLAEGDLVIVDEAGMTSTADLVAIHRHCRDAGAKLLLVGDPRQLAAVGAGGALADLTDRAATYRLAEVRRFTHSWEGPASLALRDGDPAALGEYRRHGRLVDGGTPDETERDAARAWLADTLAGRDSVLLVGSNSQAARVNAMLRAQLVDLGRVAETGVELGRDGTTAGVGDLVQARRNGWELRGVAGNARAPLNRETYRVTAVHDDGALTVTSTTGPDDDAGEPERMVLPASYVAADLTLGYAGTVHGAQGRTVDTAHAVLGPGTNAAAAYVALTRGRERNTAHVETRPLGSDAPTGEAHQAARRTAAAVLADSLERAEPDRTPVAEAEYAAAEAASTQTHGERLIAVAADATAERTASLLDHLAADGTLTEQDRRALAADDGLASLDRLLRTAEIGHRDPAALLRDAIAQRDLTGTRSPARVLHTRLHDQLAGHRAPTITSWHDLVPSALREDWDTYLRNRADVADERRHQLGAQAAEDCPQWAREALGPVPDDPAERLGWEQAAGWAASWRELADHSDDTTPLGPAPTAGRADQQAVWRTAHHALGLPDRSGDEDELSTGQLRIRAAAYRREQAWAPRYVGDELDATHQAAARRRADAEVWVARAAAAVGEHERRTHQAQADAARAEADTLDQRAATLEDVDQARAAWYADTAVTRDTADRAHGALKARGVDLDDPDDRVTAEEWLAAHRAEQAAEDPHRPITDDADLHDQAGARDRDEAQRATDAVREADHADVVDADPALEAAVPDIREVATPDASEHADPAERHRVPTAEYAAASVARAQTALAELGARRRADDARQADKVEWARGAEPDLAHDTGSGREREQPDALGAE